MQLSREWLEKEPWFRPEEYPFQSHFLPTEYGPLHYIDENLTGRSDAPIIVFVHGTPSWSYEYRHWILALRKQYRCLALDHLGFGLSSRPENAPYTLSMHTLNLKAWIQHLGIKRAIWFLHDFGGPIGLPLLQENPSLAQKLILMNTWAWPMETVDPAFAKNKRWLDTPLMKFLYLRLNFSAQMMVKLSWGKSRKLTSQLHDGFRKMFPNRESRLGTWAFAQALVRDTTTLEGVGNNCALLSALPTTVLWGMGDSLVNAAHFQNWKKLLPFANFIEIALAGHFPQAEAPVESLQALHSALES